jgi:hypothetical protein
MVLESGLLRDENGHYEVADPFPPSDSWHRTGLTHGALDRLAAVKKVAQLGATLGRALSYELLRAVSPMDEVTLQQALARLVEAELLYQRKPSPKAKRLWRWPRRYHTRSARLSRWTMLPCSSSSVGRARSPQTG